MEEQIKEPITQQLIEEPRESEEKSYPTTPDKDGWYYETEGEEALEIETRVDENEDMFKRVQMSKGRVCVLRELTKKEGQKAAQIGGVNSKTSNMKGAQDRALSAYVALSGTFTDKDGKTLTYVMEDIELFKARDANRLTTAATKLNF